MIRTDDRLVRGLAVFIFLAVLGLSLVLLARAFFGPLDFPVRMHSPRNVQDWIAFGVLLLIAWRAQLGSVPKSRYFRRFPRAILPATIVFGTTLLLFSPWLSTGFLSDDFIHVEFAATADSLENFFGTGDGFFQPIGYLSLVITGAVAGKESKSCALASVRRPVARYKQSGSPFHSGF